ncbi:hypothetical protein TVAG_102950 [Trichomonas vaginalis G3]|uniref:Uncharacterized protein n=1 Tax=Trichomonas vaginalis (strain ATCC PRA-98 / G3) TaxID=412133 RepID=A2G785_TRIV3|nr:hypothetical protein TVAGG3_1019590 [Trichomonas vaginalis G3]XP_001579106.2 hypothetical protein TVAGG3_1024580 [Trichomonas vaginalis G3]EAX86982.1 hypothetical protein TVAG_102950 [Trichomonas vaginalis G3]KAI5492044.1 hypothetical protein TVAGG3_1019590 [Trichomonas vaginalis G3]KAI5492398.1 hypothetical protein TVAGG3_1024580 [Trichomonas vaginalis G3]|eukprot:XP_001299912.1 hypothetical protein [Trichomonas vaginalis G3]
MGKPANKSNKVYGIRQTIARKKLREEIMNDEGFWKNCLQKFTKMKAYKIKGILIRYCQKNSIKLDPEFARGHKESLYWFYKYGKIEEFERVKEMAEIVSGAECKYIKFTGELSDDTDPVDGFIINNNGVIQKLCKGRSKKRDLSKYDEEKNPSESGDLKPSSAQMSDWSDENLVQLDFLGDNFYYQYETPIEYDLNIQLETF